MPRNPKPFVGLEALLFFPRSEDRAVTLDLTRRFSSAVRFAYNRRLEGKNREELKRQDGSLCALFRLNTRYADDAVMKARALLGSAREKGLDPRKVVFGGRGLFEQLWLRVNLGDGTYAYALVKTTHPNLNALVERVYAELPYNVELSLREGRVYAHFTWEEELPDPVHTKEKGVLALDMNADPYHLALAVVAPGGNVVRHHRLSLEEVDRAPSLGAKEIALWKTAHQVVSLAEEYGVAIATERLKHLRKSRKGDGSGRRFRRKQHRFAYRSLLEKIHVLARRRGVEVVEVNPQDTSTIGMLKYAPALSLSKDAAAAFVIGRRALGFEERLPKGYEALLRDEGFRAHARSFYEARIQELQARKDAEKNPCLKRKLSRDLGRARADLKLVLSLHGSPGSRRGPTDGRNPHGANPWRVLRVGTFLPLLGRMVPRDLSALKPVLVRGSWEGWKASPDPHPGGGSVATDSLFRVGVDSGG